MLKPTLSCLGPLVIALGIASLSEAQEQALRPGAEALGASERQDDGGPMFAREANQELWVERLSATDLQLRQSSYDLLLLRARLDPSVENFLKQLAVDSGRPELAWTARLGLRELDLRHKLELCSSANPAELVSGPYGSDQRLQAIMRQLVIEYPAWQFGIQEVGPRDAQPESLANPINPGQRANQTVTVRTDVLGIYVKRMRAGETPAAGPNPGLVVELIEPGSIANRMELAVGDLLLRVNGQPIYLPEDITMAMERRSRTQPIQVEWIDRSQVTQSATWTPVAAPPGS